LAIGDSAMSWNGESLSINISELAVPRFCRLQGRVRLYPNALTNCDFALDAAGRHRWRPIAPRARVDVWMTRPAMRWCGSAYFDSNCGSAPLEDDFRLWTWSRADLDDGGSAVLYDVVRRSGGPLALALRFDGADGCERFEPPNEVSLPKTGWRIERSTRTEGATGTVILRTLEDTPFYARSIVRSDLLGERPVSMHESLSLDRFRSRWVQALLPFRMPRAPR
jgi:carotenoid 1,2-hydratase